MIGALRAVVEGNGDHVELRKAADDISSLPGSDVVGDSVWITARLVRALAMAVQWAPAIREADPNPARFREAARQQAADVMEALSDCVTRPGLVSAATALASLEDPSVLPAVATSMLTSPLPVRVTTVSLPRAGRSGAPATFHEPVHRVLPILVLLSIDGQPLPEPLRVRPNRVITVQIEAVAPEWPDDAVALEVDFVGVLPPEVISVSGTSLTRANPRGETSILLRGDFAPTDRPKEFVTKASFVNGAGVKRDVPVVGNPSFRLAALDATNGAPRGLPLAERKLREMLSEIDSVIGESLEAQDRRDWYSLMQGLVLYANHVLEDPAYGRGVRMHESAFQEHVKKALHMNPDIGNGLWEKTSASGGETDLGLGKVVLELKVEHDSAVSLEDAYDYVGQTTQYSADFDSQLSILCILDDSPKSQPAGVQANYMGVIRPALHGLDAASYPALVSVVIVQAGFPLPSRMPAQELGEAGRSGEESGDLNGGDRCEARQETETDGS